MLTIHSAAKPVGLIQKCSRCGVILQDYTNALSVGDWHPVWWEGNVFIEGRFSGATEEAANCEAVMNDKSETLLEKVDILTNLVEQMLLAHRMRDEQKFNEAHDKASQIGFEITLALQEHLDLIT